MQLVVQILSLVFAFGVLAIVTAGPGASRR